MAEENPLRPALLQKKTDDGRMSRAFYYGTVLDRSYSLLNLQGHAHAFPVCAVEERGIGEEAMIPNVGVGLTSK